MADRMFHPLAGALEQKVVHLYGKMVVGAAGAVTSYTGKGIASIALDTAGPVDGRYHITLSDKYNDLLWGDVMVLDDTDSDPLSVGVVARLYAEAVDSTKIVTVQFYDFTDGSPVDPASGATVYFKLELKNSSV